MSTESPTRERCANVMLAGAETLEAHAPYLGSDADWAPWMRNAVGYLRADAARIAELEKERDRWKANAQDWADDAAGAKAERNALAAEVEGLTAERDAARDVANAPADAFMEKRAEWWAEHAVLVRQLASCRKALEWLIEQGIVVRLRRMGATGYYPAAKYPDEDIHPALVRERLAAAAGVPLADLTGEEVPA
jgi:hypothetical protein